MILTYFFHQTLNRCFSYIMSKEKKNHKIWPLKVYSNLNLERITGRKLLSLHTCRLCCLRSHFTCTQDFVVHILPFCPNLRLLRLSDSKYEFFHCEDSVTGGEVDLWLGYHRYLLLIASFTNLLIYFTAPTLQ